MSLLGELLHLGSGIAAIASPIAALQRTFLGKYVPLEVFRVNMTALTPTELCHYLTQLNPGSHLVGIAAVVPQARTGQHMIDIGASRLPLHTDNFCTDQQALLSARAMGPWHWMPPAPPQATQTTCTRTT